MRKILYDKKEGRLNEDAARRMHDDVRDDLNKYVNGELRGEVRGDVQKGKLGDLRGELDGEVKGEVDGANGGSAGQMGMEELVRKLEELCEDMAVVKGYILALQRPLMDKCNTWIDGSTVTEVLRISAKTLKKLRENGTMPFSKVGGKIYYQLEDMEGLLRRNYSMGIKAGGGDE